jgi:D-arabinose 1-dehydrogenase-like Zn-dependent alcohol dehydrogenase
MRAAVIRDIGSIELVEDWAEPTAGAGQVVVRVAACGVCYRDLIDRDGKYPFLRRPVVTGHEVAGTIERVGAGAGAFAVGDRVVAVHRAPCGACPACATGEETRCLASPVMYGVTVDGAYAERVALWESSLVRVPDGVALEAAAVLHCTAAVALRALRKHARLAAGETVVITGATGGVGVHAVQVARVLGARVIAVTSSEDKGARLRAELGLAAEEIVVARDAGWHKEVMARTGGGADVALELVGAPTFNASLRSLRFGGRLVVVGNVTTERVEVNPGYVIARELAVLGSASATRAELAEVLGWVQAGRLRPIIAARRPLGEARAAQAALSDKQVLGRQILVP